jgi:hypothetical protein
MNNLEIIQEKFDALQTILGADNLMNFFGIACKYIKAKEPFENWYQKEAKGNIFIYNIILNHSGNVAITIEDLKNFYESVKENYLTKPKKINPAQKEMLGLVRKV